MDFGLEVAQHFLERLVTQHAVGVRELEWHVVRVDVRNLVLNK